MQSDALKQESGNKDHDKPTQGHFAMCLYCCEVSVFSEELILRKITFEELMQIEKESPATALKIHLFKEAFKKIQIQKQIKSN